jgi:hypothetical protein
MIANFKAYYLRTTFANPDITLKDFCKSYSIYHPIQNIAKASAEVTQMCMNRVWKKICPEFIPDFQGFKKDEMFEEVSEKIVKLAKQLELEVDEHDVEELIDSHAEQLSNADLIELCSQLTSIMLCAVELRWVSVSLYNQQNILRVSSSYVPRLLYLWGKSSQYALYRRLGWTQS